MIGIRSIVLAVAAIILPAAVLAETPPFKPGPMIAEYGAAAAVPGAENIPPGTVFKVAFDVSDAGEAGSINRRFNSLARFLNMHGQAGVPIEDMRLALIVHGTAAVDLTQDARYGGTNANAGLIKALVDAGVDVMICGQSMAARNIQAEELLPGVQISLSAMTAHALLQQQGFSLNPF